MNVPSPFDDHARDDRFNHGLDRLLHGDTTGIEDIESELQDVSLEMVSLANEAGWIGSDPGNTRVQRRLWWSSGQRVFDAVAALVLVGLIAVIATLGVRIWSDSSDQFGSNTNDVMITEMGPGVCSREPRTTAEIASIVRKTEREVEPFRSSGVRAEMTGAALQLLRDWNTCLQAGLWDRALAYESEYFLWALGQEEFPEGTVDFTDAEIAARLVDRQARISTINTTDGLNLAVYSVENFRYAPGDEQILGLGADYWIVPRDADGHWIGWSTVVTTEWDGEQWVVVSANRDGVPDSKYFRDDALQEGGTPEP